MYKIGDIKKGDVVLSKYIYAPVGTIYGEVIEVYPDIKNIIVIPTGCDYRTECRISDVQAVYRLVEPSV